jgi:hypothetical protein
MKLSTIFRFAAANGRYLALALPLFALFSTVQVGCSGTAKGGYYNYVAGSSGDPRKDPPRDCPTYTIYTGYGGYTSYNPCDDNGGYGP